MKCLFCRNNPSFTFIELLVVIVIAGILIAIAVPNFRKTFDNFELDNFVKELYYRCRYLKEMAVNQGKIYCLKIIRDANQVQFQPMYKNTQGTWVSPGTRLGKPYIMPRALSIGSMEPGRIDGIYFYPDGSVDPVAISFQNKFKNKLTLIIKGAAGDIQIK
ncbi:MAG: prepilin-type N-terminal cleavage/methylation domain-containing protein [Candidatus Omnitrophica bacterium]|nr:prepilin-type N-terminal cleavage/methylation domain-containing protein [Candidatus Omnitrophota bacterium]